MAKKKEDDTSKELVTMSPGQLQAVEETQSMLKMMVAEEQYSKLDKALIFTLLKSPDAMWGWADTDSGAIPTVYKMQAICISMKYSILPSLGQLMILGNKVYVTVAGASTLAKRQKLIKSYSYRPPTKEEKDAYQIGTKEFYVVIKVELHDGSILEESGRASAADTPSKLSRHLKNLEETAKTRAWGHVYKRILDLDAPIHDESVMSDADYYDKKTIVDKENTEEVAETIVQKATEEKTTLAKIEPAIVEEEKKNDYSALEKEKLVEKAMKFKNRAYAICQEKGLDFKNIILEYFNGEPSPESLENFSKIMGEINNKNTIGGKAIPKKFFATTYNEDSDSKWKDESPKEENSPDDSFSFNPADVPHGTEDAFDDLDAFDFSPEQE